MPVNSDDFSAGAIKMMLRKLYNRFPVGEDHPFYEEMVETSFAAKSKKFIKQLEQFPKVRVLVHNRENKGMSSRGAKALIKMRNDINSRLHNEAVVNFAEAESQKIGLDMLVPPKVSVASSNHHNANHTAARAKLDRQLLLLKPASSACRCRLACLATRSTPRKAKTSSR